MCDRGALLTHAIKLLCAFAIRDKPLYLCHVCTKLDILWCQECGTGNGNSTQLHQAKHRLPPFRNARQHDHHTVPFLNANGGEGVRSTARAFSELSIRNALLFTVLPHPEHGKLVRVFRPLAHHINGEIELCGNIEMETTSFFLVIGHMRCFGYDHRNAPYRYI